MFHFVNYAPTSPKTKTIKIDAVQILFLGENCPMDGFPVDNRPFLIIGANPYERYTLPLNENKKK